MFMASSFVSVFNVLVGIVFRFVHRCILLYLIWMQERAVSLANGQPMIKELEAFKFCTNSGEVNKDRNTFSSTGSLCFFYLIPSNLPSNRRFPPSLPPSTPLPPPALFMPPLQCKQKLKENLFTYFVW